MHNAVAIGRWQKRMSYSVIPPNEVITALVTKPLALTLLLPV
jgi:hypothetical protein